MPHRIPILWEQSRDWLVVLWEPLMFWAFAAASAAGAASITSGGQTHIEWLSLAGYGMGSIIDLAARGRAYAALPEARRKSRWRHPLVNTLCVGAFALPLVDFTRALARFLSGQSDVFGGLVINFVRARSGAGGQTPPQAGGGS